MRDQLTGRQEKGSGRKNRIIGFNIFCSEDALYRKFDTVAATVPPVMSGKKNLERRRFPMKVTVRTFGSLRELAEPQVEVEIRDGASVAGLLEVVFRRHPDLESELFSSPGTLRRYVNVLLNGKNIEFLRGLDTPLSEGDVLALFPPAEGG
jgi:molybdopterin synthase sulfur carrier subunit